MVTLELVYDRPTKRTVRFYNEDFGTVYVPNAVYQELGHPERLTITIEAAAPALTAAA